MYCSGITSYVVVAYPLVAEIAPVLFRRSLATACDSLFVTIGSFRNHFGSSSELIRNTCLYTSISLVASWHRAAQQTASVVIGRAADAFHGLSGDI